MDSPPRAVHKNKGATGLVFFSVTILPRVMLEPDLSSNIRFVENWGKIILRRATGHSKRILSKNKISLINEVLLKNNEILSAKYILYIEDSILCCNIHIASVIQYNIWIILSIFQNWALWTLRYRLKRQKLNHLLLHN